MSTEPTAACQHGRYSIDTETQKGRCVLCGAEGRMEFVVPSPRAGDGKTIDLVWHGLSQSEVLKIVEDICDHGTSFVAPLITIVELIDKVLRERNATAPTTAAAPAVSAPAWQPIETAPKDVLVWVNATKRMSGPCIAMHHSRDGWVVETPSEWVSIYTPTHWMPYTPPAGPEVQAPATADGSQS